MCSQRDLCKHRKAKMGRGLIQAFTYIYFKDATLFLKALQGKAGSDGKVDDILA